MKKKHGKNIRMRDRFYYIGRNTCPAMATSGFRDSSGPFPLGEMRSVLYRRTTRASKTASKYGTFSSFFFGIQPHCPSWAV
jgi:hypothetical protein